MYKRVDEEVSNDKVEGYSYISKNGILEYVRLSGGGVVIEDSTGESAYIHLSDIPKLIMALKAASENNF